MNGQQAQQSSLTAYRRAEADFLEFIATDKEQQRSADPAFDDALYDHAVALIQERLRTMPTGTLS